jgi:DNA (cytosine-5)-methyltransferase 1
MPAVAFQTSQSGVRTGEAHATLDSNNGSRRHNGVIAGSAVRRLTPRECERLQGFPDDYTLIPYRGKPAADGPRYKALGNSMAVPVMAWIGERIAAVNALASLEQREAA